MAEKQAQVIPEDEHFLSDEDAFEQAFNERYGVESDPEQSAADDGEDHNRQAAPQRGEADDGRQAVPGESDQRHNEQTADSSAEDQSGDDAPEWFKNLSEDAQQEILTQQQELARLRENYNAVHNRLAPVQQENARLRQQLSSNSRPAKRQDSVADSVGQPPSFDLAKVEEFKEYRETFPEEAKALEAVFSAQAQTINHLQAQLGGISEGLQNMQQSSFSQQRERELNRLSEAHPDWASVRPSEDFAQWLEVQPPSISQMANSPKADDCIWLLDRYKTDAYVAQQFAQQGEQQPEQAPSGNGRAQQTRSRRQQLRSVPTVPSQQDGGVGAPNMGGEHLSDEELWDQEVLRRLRAQREANR